jgi:hypothetical protein
MNALTYIYFGYSVFYGHYLIEPRSLRPYAFEGFVDPRNKGTLGISLVLVVVIILWLLFDLLLSLELVQTLETITCPIAVIGRAEFFGRALAMQ